MKSSLSLFLLNILLLTGCQQKFTFVDYPPPELTVDFSVFENVGCPRDKYGIRYCEPESPLTALGCDRIEEEQVLGGLQPSYPIARCILYGDDTANIGFFNIGGYLSPAFVEYVIFKDGEFQLLENVQDFQSVYIPIESEEEALSYVIALKNIYPYFSFYEDPLYVYYVDQAEGTHVDMSGNDFIVHTFYADYPGCGEYHAAYSVDFRVTTDGKALEFNRQPFFSNPEFDDMCAD